MAILDLKMDIQAVAARITDVEKTTQLHTAAIRQYSTHMMPNSHIFMNYTAKLKTTIIGAGVRGVPESLEAGSLPQVVCAIFNDLLD